MFNGKKGVLMSVFAISKCKNDNIPIGFFFFIVTKQT